MQNNIKCPNCNSLMHFNLDEWGRTPWHLHCDNCDINIGTTSINKAIDLLFQNINKTPNQDNATFSCECMDEYGNYVYSTDVTISQPNTAYGSSVGFRLIQIIDGIVYQIIEDIAVAND